MTNEKHCKPPLDNSEFEKEWKQATQLIIPQIEKEEQEQQQEQTQGQMSQAALSEELAKEVSFDDIASILSISIKKDKAPKLITFCAMLLAQTEKDQLTIGFQAESSAGKSYIPIEVSMLFPASEVQTIASASPTSFYHDYAKWDDKRKALIKDLAHNNLIFLDQPHFQLLEKLRPMLSRTRKSCITR